VIDWLKRHLSKYIPRVMAVVVDATGGGNPVMDFLRQADLGATLIGVVIVPNMTGGSGTTLSGYRTISRTELLTNLQIAVQARKFTIETKECRESQASAANWSSSAWKANAQESRMTSPSPWPWQSGGASDPEPVRPSFRYPKQAPGPKY